MLLVPFCKNKQKSLKVGSVQLLFALQEVNETRIYGFHNSYTLWTFSDSIPFIQKECIIKVPSELLKSLTLFVYTHSSVNKIIMLIRFIMSIKSFCNKAPVKFQNSYWPPSKIFKKKLKKTKNCPPGGQGVGVRIIFLYQNFYLY